MSINSFEEMSMELRLLEQFLNFGVSTILLMPSYPGKYLQETSKGVPLQDVIVSILKAKWDHERTAFSLPPLLNLVIYLHLNLFMRMHIHNYSRVCLHRNHSQELMMNFSPF